MSPDRAAADVAAAARDPSTRAKLTTVATQAVVGVHTVVDNFLVGYYEGQAQELARETEGEAAGTAQDDPLHMFSQLAQQVLNTDTAQGAAVSGAAPAPGASAAPSSAVAGAAAAGGPAGNAIASAAAQAAAPAETSAAGSADALSAPSTATAQAAGSTQPLPPQQQGTERAGSPDAQSPQSGSLR
jgi:hypothetical protein